MAQERNDHQEATVRKQPPAGPVMAADSPSRFSSPLKRERKALEALAGYIGNRLPTVDSPKHSRTPLNPSTILRAAFREIQVGPEAPYFKTYTFFAEDAAHPEAAQMVLQAPINLDIEDSAGRKNLARMSEGRSPIGADGRKIHLHHLLQEDGILAELSSRVHKKLHNQLHPRLASGSSKVNRHQFGTFRKKYWKNRLHQLQNPSVKMQKSARKSLF